MARRMADVERAAAAATAATAALAARRQGDLAEANQLLIHAVHAGVQPFELLDEIITRTGGRL